MFVVIQAIFIRKLGIVNYRKRLEDIILSWVLVGC